MNIYVFKTSITPADVRRVNSLLRSVIPECIWNFDLEDCDNILRIESSKDIRQPVCHQLQVLGIACEELA